MLVLKAEQIRKEWNGSPLFENVGLELSEGEHVALIGRNGVGKTTLMQILVGSVPPDAGTVYRRYPINAWGFLQQNLQLESGVTLADFVQSGTPEKYKLKQQLDALQRQLDRSDDSSYQYRDDQLERVALRYSHLQQQYADHGGYEWETRVEKTLSQLQLPPDTWPLPYEQLSGGQKTRAQLARLVIHNPRLLVLDEPTNHLDRETLAWLEGWVRKFPGAVLFISHDRQFIDQVAHATYELTATGTKRYKGGYREYRQQHDLEQQTKQAQYDKQERERQALREAIQRYRQWFRQAHNAAGERNPGLKKKANKNMTRFKAKEQALERLEKNRTPRPREEVQLKTSFGEGNFTARTLITLDGVSFSYEQRNIFSHLSFSVSRGDRLAVIGRNGTGKTTLLKLLTGSLSADSGEVIRHPQINVGYFAQELEVLNKEETIVDSLLGLPNMTEAHARTILACFLFRGDTVFKKIGELSMGERCRVAFVKLYFSEANLLVLDEPTNYLDIDTRERIEAALLQYPGSLIVVSHDRYLLQKVANKVIDLENRPIRLFPGTYSDYVDTFVTRADSSHDAAKQNRVRELELKMTQLMSTEQPEDPGEQQKLLGSIRKTRALLNELKGEG